MTGSTSSSSQTLTGHDRPAGSCRKRSLRILGSITKGHGAQLRILVNEWRGQRRLELRD